MAYWAMIACFSWLVMVVSPFKKYIWHTHRGRLVKCRITAVSANRAHVMLCHYTIRARFCKEKKRKFSKSSQI
jgi:hypothetical protein